VRRPSVAAHRRRGLEISPCVEACHTARLIARESFGRAPRACARPTRARVRTGRDAPRPSDREEIVRLCAAPTIASDSFGRAPRAGAPVLPRRVAEIGIT